MTVPQTYFVNRKKTRVQAKGFCGPGLKSFRYPIYPYLKFMICSYSYIPRKYCTAIISGRFNCFMGQVWQEYSNITFFASGRHEIDFLFFRVRLGLIVIVNSYNLPARHIFFFFFSGDYVGPPVFEIIMHF